jgi:hypothetical protein
MTLNMEEQRQSPGIGERVGGGGGEPLRMASTSVMLVILVVCIVCMSGSIV